MKKIKQIPYSYIALILSIGAVLFVIYAFTAISPFQQNPYNTYALQADSWLHGRLDLGQNYEALELAVFNGKYFVSFPPFPSYILLPFSYFMGVNTPDNLLALLSLFVGAIYAMKLVHEFCQDERKCLLYTLFVYIGCNTLYTSLNGWVWFIAQNFAMTLTFMALYYAKKKKCGLSLLFWACAVGCRPFQALYLPILLYWIYQGESSVLLWLKKKWSAFIPCVCVALSYMALNIARFGNPFEFGHNYLPEFTRTTTGQFSFTYFMDNLRNLLRLPAMTESTKLDFYDTNGFAFWLVSPLFICFMIALIYAWVKRRQLKYNKFELIVFPLCLLLHITMLLMHKTMGGYHFGNRYLNDLLPVALMGVVYFMPKENKLWSTIQYPLFILGITLNTAGTIISYNNWLG